MERGVRGRLLGLSAQGDDPGVVSPLMAFTQPRQVAPELCVLTKGPRERMTEEHRTDCSKGTHSV